jgi:hypothetical protein
MEISLRFFAVKRCFANPISRKQLPEYYTGFPVSVTATRFISPAFLHYAALQLMNKFALLQINTVYRKIM